MNPFLATDGYKTGHHKMYPEGTSLVYSNFTPRSNKHAPKECKEVVSFGQQMVMRQIHEMFDKDFFMRDVVNDYTFDKYGHIATTPEQWREYIKNEVCSEIEDEYSLYLGTEYDVNHIEALWDLGYLPLEVKALPEGTLVPVGVPVLTIYNTQPEFFWLTNFLETLISNLLWKPITSATMGYAYRRKLDSWCHKTDKESMGFVDFQAHDFSMRGLDNVGAVISSGLGHACSFLGSDSLPVIHGARKYYDEPHAVVHSVNATEHSVMCAGGTEEGDELATFRYLMSQFPTGILSIVSDTWDLWKVLIIFLPILKEEILARDGKIVIRPDSGDPVDIICGDISPKDLSEHKYCKSLEDCGTYISDSFREELVEDAGHGECGDSSILKTFKFKNKFYNCIGYPEWNRHDKEYYYIDGMTHKIEEVELTVENKGVIELLWDVFGGTTNDQGYRVLDSHIGAIYGDSITLARAEEICSRLAAKGFASTNIVLGVGSFTYQYNTRDTFGFAMKATYVELTKDVEGGTNTFGREIFKDPITDDGTKKSAKGLLMVGELGDGTYELHDQVDWETENKGSLQSIYREGKFLNITSLTEIRRKLKN